jgi:hypothetical protein
MSSRLANPSMVASAPLVLDADRGFTIGAKQSMLRAWLKP